MTEQVKSRGINMRYLIHMLKIFNICMCLFSIKSSGYYVIDAHHFTHSDMRDSIFSRKVDSMLTKNTSSNGDLLTALSNFSFYDSSIKGGQTIIIYQQEKKYDHIPFRVTIPQNYTFQNSSPLIIILHGATALGSFSLAETRKEDISAEVTKELDVEVFKRTALQNNYIVVEPFADNSKDYNWVLIRDENHNALESIENVIKDLKGTLNIDDSRVYIAGHSDGADGAWGLIDKRPSTICAALVYNSMYKVFYSPVFLKNLSARSLYLIHSDLDDIRPVEQAREVSRMLDSLNIDFIYKEYHGYKHDDSHIAKDIDSGFEYLSSHVRNPFRTSIYWETHNPSSGRCDWLKIEGINSSTERAPWHKDYNVPSYNKKTKLFKGNYYLNDFLSAAVVSKLYNNSYHIKTSCVKNITILISPLMVNLENPIKVFINEVLVFDSIVPFNKQFLIDNFKDHKDKQALWVNSLTFEVK